MKNLTKCNIEGHYYKIDVGEDITKAEISGSDKHIDGKMICKLANIGATFYVKCQRCGYRILINDKTYEERKAGTYNL